MAGKVDSAGNSCTDADRLTSLRAALIKTLHPFDFAQDGNKIAHIINVPYERCGDNRFSANIFYRIQVGGVRGEVNNSQLPYELPHLFQNPVKLYF